MKANDVDLIQRTLDGDQDAFTKLVNKYQKWVHALVWRKIGDFHSPDLTGNIMQEIARIKPAAPSASKPWIPWGLSFASTFLVILMIGTGPRALSRFQQPYNLDATSEMTIELVEDPVLLALEQKRDVRNQYGITGNVGSGTGTGTKTDERLLAAAQADTTEQLETKPRWILANGPGGGSASNLFLTSQKDLYAISGAQLYRSTGDNNTDWMLINAELPTPNYNTLIAERNGRLYIATQKHLFVSIDRGATLTPVGPLPEGRAVALLITDPSQVRHTATFPFPYDKPKLPLIELSEVHEMMRKLPHFKDIVYLGNTVYITTNNGGARSNDGENWQPFTNEKSVPITLSELAVKGTTLYGTSETGTYRLNNETNTWIQIAPKVPRGVTSLVVADDALYVGTRQRGVLRLSLHGRQ